MRISDWSSDVCSSDLSPPLLPAARRLFAGLAGLESPYSSDALSAGELSAIIAAGYASVAGVFGLHRFHHVAGDAARCIDAASVAATTAAFATMPAEAARACATPMPRYRACRFGAGSGCRQPRFPQRTRRPTSSPAYVGTVPTT